MVYRRKFTVISVGSVLGVNGLNKPAIGADFQIGSIDNSHPENINLLNINLTEIQIYPRYLDDTSDLNVKIIVSVEDGRKTDKEATVTFQNGEVINLNKIRNRSGVDVGNLTISPINSTENVLNGEIGIKVTGSIASETLKKQFTVSRGNVIFTDDFLRTNGDSLGNDYIISQGLRRSRNNQSNNSGFTFKKDASSNMSMSHSGSTGSNGFGEIALDLRDLSNIGWIINLDGHSWTYNSEENNYRMGVVDRTDRSNFCEFMETESSGVNPRVQGNNINSRNSFSEVSFSGEVKYDWSFEMDDGIITVLKDGAEVFSKTGYPSGEYTWFVMNESDGDTSSAETHLLDKIEVLRPN